MIAGAGQRIDVVPVNWADYERVHTDRRNLLIHLAAVPLFDVSVVLLVAGLAGGYRVIAVAAAIGMPVAMLLQRIGHNLEREAPRPFAGPADLARRWFTEQFVTFPSFVLSGRWWRQYTAHGASENVG